MAETRSTLESLSSEELREVVINRLHERQSIGPAVDLRAEESHIEWLIDQFRLGRQDLRDRMSVVLRQLLAQD
jgi:hypothetical protein